MIKRHFIAFAALGLTLFGLGGCRKEPPLPEGRVISLYFSGNQMRDYYGYHLREQDGQILFDARCNRFRNEFQEINLENAIAAPEDLETLRALCEAHGFAEKLRTYREPKPGPFVADGSSVHFDVTWEDGTRLYAGTVFDGEQALRDFFEALAIRLG